VFICTAQLFAVFWQRPIQIKTVVSLLIAILIYGGSMISGALIPNFAVGLLLPFSLRSIIRKSSRALSKQPVPAEGLRGVVGVLARCRGRAIFSVSFPAGCGRYSTSDSSSETTGDCHGCSSSCINMIRMGGWKRLGKEEVLYVFL
jgi:hypothetical protein